MTISNKETRRKKRRNDNNVERQENYDIDNSLAFNEEQPASAEEEGSESDDKFDYIEKEGVVYITPKPAVQYATCFHQSNGYVPQQQT